MAKHFFLELLGMVSVGGRTVKSLVISIQRHSPSPYPNFSSSFSLFPGVISIRAFVSRGTTSPGLTHNTKNIHGSFWRT